MNVYSGGYYGLVFVKPQTLPRSHDNLSNPYQIATLIVITFVCSVMRSYCPEILETLGSTITPQLCKIFNCFHLLDLKFLSDCFP